MCTDNCAVTITPESKIAAVLHDFPQLETTIAELSPSFASLTTPALRQTVAGTTTLAGLAQADGLSLGMIVARLREAAGLESSTVGGSKEARPEWANIDSTARSFDARQMIEQGGHPLERVTQGVAQLAANEVYELITPFVPSPLINLVQGKGFEAHCVNVAPGECRTYFRRP
jgi:hypothetical protein